MSDIITDVEGNQYKTITIGNQIWMAENLRTSKFSNGESIEFVSDGLQWQNTTSPYQTLYNNSLGNLSFGRLYNWFCVKSLKGICPAGWRMPDLNDWEILVNQYGGWNEAGLELCKADLFNAELFGLRAGSFEGLSQTVHYWTSVTETDQPDLPPPGQTSKSVSIKKADKKVYITNEYQIEGFYIRCVKI